MTLADRSLTAAEVDRLTDDQLSALRRSTQALATYTQKIVQRYQRQVARIDAEAQRRAARKRAA